MIPIIIPIDEFTYIQPNIPLNFNDNYLLAMKLQRISKNEIINPVTVACYEYNIESDEEIEEMIDYFKQLAHQMFPAKGKLKNIPQ